MRHPSAVFSDLLWVLTWLSMSLRMKQSMSGDIEGEQGSTCMKWFQVSVRSNSTMRAMTCHRGASNSACSFTLWTLLSAKHTELLVIMSSIPG